jgi:hypothetical protein
LASLPKIKENVLVKRKNSKKLLGRWNYNISEPSECKAVASDKYNVCSAIVEMNNIPYVFAFNVGRFFSSYEVKKIHKYDSLSQCQSQEEIEERHDYLFGQFKHLSLQDMNRNIRTHQSTNKFLADSKRWDRLNPKWSEKELSKEEIELAIEIINKRLSQ